MYTVTKNIKLSAYAMSLREKLIK